MCINEVYLNLCISEILINIKFTWKFQNSTIFITTEHCIAIFTAAGWGRRRLSDTSPGSFWNSMEIIIWLTFVWHWNYRYLSLISEIWWTVLILPVYPRMYRRVLCLKGSAGLSVWPSLRIIGVSTTLLGSFCLYVSWRTDRSFTLSSLEQNMLYTVRH